MLQEVVFYNWWDRARAWTLDKWHSIRGGVLGAILAAVRLFRVAMVTYDTIVGRKIVERGKKGI